MVVPDGTRPVARRSALAAIPAGSRVLWARSAQDLLFG